MGSRAQPSSSAGVDSGNTTGVPAPRPPCSRRWALSSPVRAVRRSSRFKSVRRPCFWQGRFKIGSYVSAAPRPHPGTHSSVFRTGFLSPHEPAELPCCSRASQERVSKGLPPPKTELAGDWPCLCDVTRAAGRGRCTVESASLVGGPEPGLTPPTKLAATIPLQPSARSCVWEPPTNA